MLNNLLKKERINLRITIQCHIIDALERRSWLVDNLLITWFCETFHANMVLIFVCF